MNITSIKQNHPIRKQKSELFAITHEQTFRQKLSLEIDDSAILNNSNAITLFLIFDLGLNPQSHEM